MSHEQVVAASTSSANYHLHHPLRQRRTGQVELACFPRLEVPAPSPILQLGLNPSTIYSLPFHWANGPSATDQPTSTHDSDHWNPPERVGRSPSPVRSRNVERSRSPLESRMAHTNGSQTTDRGRGTDVVNPGNNLHISNISPKTDDRELIELFSKYGTVIKSQLMRDPHTQEIRGFGFVTMETSDQAELVISSLNGIDYLGKTLNVEKARRSRGRTPTPGQYRGIVKRDEPHRSYDSRGGYDNRYDSYDRRGDFRPRRDHDDGRYPVRRDYDDRRSRYDDRPASYDRYAHPAAPVRDRYDDRYDRRRDDHDYDRRRY
ncbi:hypothetical protein H4Q26_001410 [Puccinia striiformis f. sp. tritici PST-130]|nr:hypothetical protein H4Q26_001410 [Puccinia striiformis f. sp. tritici PST-130]